MRFVVTIEICGIQDWGQRNNWRSKYIAFYEPGTGNRISRLFRDKERKYDISPFTKKDIRNITQCLRGKYKKQDKSRKAGKTVDGLNTIGIWRKKPKKIVIPYTLCVIYSCTLLVFCRVKFDNAFHCNRTNVELKLTGYFAISYSGSCHLEASFEIWRVEILCKINLDHTVGIHINNLDCKGLIIRTTTEQRGSVLRCVLYIFHLTNICILTFLFQNGVSQVLFNHKIHKALYVPHCLWVSRYQTFSKLVELRELVVFWRLDYQTRRLPVHREPSLLKIQIFLRYFAFIPVK